MMAVRTAVAVGKLVSEDATGSSSQSSSGVSVRVVTAGRAGRIAASSASRTAGAENLRSNNTSGGDASEGWEKLASPVILRSASGLAPGVRVMMTAVMVVMDVMAVGRRVPGCRKDGIARMDVGNGAARGGVHIAIVDDDGAAARLGLGTVLLELVVKHVCESCSTGSESNLIGLAGTSLVTENAARSGTEKGSSNVAFVVFLHTGFLALRHVLALANDSGGRQAVLRDGRTALGVVAILVMAVVVVVVRLTSLIDWHWDGDLLVDHWLTVL